MNWGSKEYKAKLWSLEENLKVNLHKREDSEKRNQKLSRKFNELENVNKKIV